MNISPHTHPRFNPAEFQKSCKALTQSRPEASARFKVDKFFQSKKADVPTLKKNLFIPNIERDIETGQALNLVSDVLNSSDDIKHLARFRKIYTLAFLAYLVASAAACTHLSPQKNFEKFKLTNREYAFAALQRGDYVTAATFFNKERCSKQDLKPEDVDRCEKVKEGVQATARYYVNRSKHLTSNNIEHFNKYLWAMEYCQRAMDLSNPGDAEHKKAEKEFMKIKAKLSTFERNYDKKYNNLVELLSQAKYDDKTLVDIQITLEELRRINIKLNKNDEKALVALALKFARKMDEEGDIKKAYDAVKATEAYLEEPTEGNDEYELASEDEQFIAMIYKNFEEAQKTRKIKLSKKRLKPIKRKAIVKKVVPKVAEVKVELEPKKTTLLPKATVESALSEARKIYDNDQNSKAIYLAIQKIKVAIEELKENPYRYSLVKQHKKWEAIRQKKIKDKLKKANKAFVRKDHQTAKQYYQEVLDLDPDHPIAYKRYNFLKNLKVKTLNRGSSKEE